MPRTARPPLRTVASALLAACSALALTALAAPVLAGEQAGAAVSGPILRLDAQAQREVTDDTAVAVFFVEREGPLPGPLQAAVNPVLKSALADLKRDPALQVRSGRYVTQPRYGRDGKIQNWQVRAELIIESGDITAVSQATATMAGRMNVGSIGFRLSDARRKETEAALTGEAAAQFYAKARAAAQALGFGNIELVEINLASSGNIGMPVMRAAMAKDSAGAEYTPVPVEPGRSQVGISFNGTVRLLAK